MSKKVLYIDLEKTINDCMVIMTNKHVRHLPVIENDKVIGMVTIGDLVNQIISEQENTIQQLENYITGTYR